VSASRRDFVKSASTAAAFAFATRAAPYVRGLAPVPTPPGSTPGDPAIRDLAMRALDAAKAAGATYADVRIQDQAVQKLVVRSGAVLQVQVIDDLFFNVRVIAGGAWGFASTTRLTADDVERAARAAVAQGKANGRGQSTPVVLAPTPPVPNGAYTTPIETDPFTVPVDRTLDMIVSAHAGAGKTTSGATLSLGTELTSMRETTSFASTEGSWIVQTLYGTLLGDIYAAIVSADNSESAFLRLDTNVPVAAGYEAIAGLRLASAYPQLIEETQRQLTAKEVDVGRYDIVFDGHAMAGLISASLAPAFEIDRALGYDQDSGMSYLAPPAKVLGTYHIGGPALTLRANANEPRGLGTKGWDSEGVAADGFTLIKNGVVVDYMTDRTFAPQLASWYGTTGQPVHSHGCTGQDDASHSPVLWWPNLTMEPASRGGTLESLIASTANGLFVGGPMFGLLDAPRMNGLYPTGTGNIMRLITNGVLGAPVKHGAVVARTTDLWRSIDAVGGAASVAPFFGMFNKGVPGENGATTISAPAARIKQLNVINTYRKPRSANT
jgi:TldD protein